MISLQKGQKVDLTKGNSGLKAIVVGLGWDAIKQKPVKKGLFGSKVQLPDIDCDASAFLLQNGRLLGDPDIVSFKNLTHKSQSILHNGDNLVGGVGFGRGDDEQIFVKLDLVPGEYDRIVFVVNIFGAHERYQDFSMVNNAYIRIFNADNNQELCKFELTEKYEGMTAMIFGEVYRHGGEWKFSAIGQATQDSGIFELAKRFV
jgi:stress response protein SCP2